MHILLTNDDGIFAPGLAALYKQLLALGTVTVVAPAEVKSGASHSISLQPLLCNKIELAGKFDGYSVAGSPADCVKLAVMELVRETSSPIDLVVSGINHGANVGINVYYSGTVAAAMEAAFFSIPSIALSAAFEEDLDLDKAAKYGVSVIKQLLPIGSGNVLNVNIPRLSMGVPRGIKVVSQSTSGFEESYTANEDRHGHTVYQLTGGSHRDKDRDDIDTTSLSDGFITVTALHFDMTDHKRNIHLGQIKWKLDP